MNSRLPSVLIVDIDNTLFDWVGVWYRAFSALLDALQPAVTAQPMAAVDARRLLLSRMQAIHRRHGSTEYPFVLSELSELSSIETGRGPMAFTPDVLRAAAARHRTEAGYALRPYPDVAETLAWFRGRGTTVVALTETRVDVSGPRLRQLGLDGVVDMLYAPEPWAAPTAPAPVSAAEAAASAATRTPVFHLWPYGEPPLEMTIARPVAYVETYAKPHPGALRLILADLDARPDEALYVGDHLDKDLPMAHAAQVPAVWARYGTRRRAHEIALLESVCHWDARPSTSRQAPAPASGASGPYLFAIDSMIDLRTAFEGDRWPGTRAAPRAKGAV